MEVVRDAQCRRVSICPSTFSAYSCRNPHYRLTIRDILDLVVGPVQLTQITGVNHGVCLFIVAFYIVLYLGFESNKVCYC